MLERGGEDGKSPLEKYENGLLESLDIYITN
jgi:hypothetical protein